MTERIQLTALVPEEMDAGDWAGIEAKVREAAALGKGT